jgi:DNA-binding CsgD family transcriptional regulator
MGKHRRENRVCAAHAQWHVRNMPLRRSDWISIIEAGYDLQGDDAHWLRRVVDHAGAILDRGAEPIAWTFRCSPSSFKLCDFSTGTSSALIGVARAAHALASEASLDLTYRSGVVIATGSELVFPRLPDMKRAFVGLVTRHVSDMLVVTCLSGNGMGMSIGVLLKQGGRTLPQERKHWPLVAAHLGAALRLRTLSTALAWDGMPVEAVLDPGGKIHDVRGPAEGAVEVRERLRQVVRHIERARTATGRNNADEALRSWEGLVSGRWSMIDKFDTDGRRFIVAVKNDPVHHDTRGLTARERQVAEWVGLGKSSTEVAYILGVSDAAVTNCTARAQEKLGLQSRAELVSFFAQNGLRRKLAEVAIADDTLLVGASPLIDERTAAGLTRVENTMVVQLVAGSTNADIASRRGVSERTVANQVQSIFRKMGVRSRAELVVRLQSPR